MLRLCVSVEFLWMFRISRHHVPALCTVRVLQLLNVLFFFWIILKRSPVLHQVLWTCWALYWVSNQRQTKLRAFQWYLWVLMAAVLWTGLLLMTFSSYLIEVTLSWTTVFSLITLVNATGLGIFLAFGDAQRVDQPDDSQVIVVWPGLGITFRSFVVSK